MMFRLFMIVALFALVSAAHSEQLTFADGFNVGWAEQRGPQFLFAWTEGDIATVRRALAKLEDEHQRDPHGIDDYLMGRRARILKKLDAPGFMLYGMYWDIDLVDAQGKRWRLQPMSTPETTLVGFAVSRDRYCRPEDQDIDDMVEAGAHCAFVNGAAIELFERIANSKHMTPGGRQ